MKKICFVCSGNTCRSPMAEKIFSAMLKKEKIKNISVSSAGISIEPNTEMSILAKRAVKKLGYKAGRKKSKQLTQIFPSILYIAMSENEKKYLNQRNVLSFAEIVSGVDIADPYGKNQQVYDATAKQIEDYCKILLGKVRKI